MIRLAQSCPIKMVQCLVSDQSGPSKSISEYVYASKDVNYSSTEMTETTVEKTVRNRFATLIFVLFAAGLIFIIGKDFMSIFHSNASTTTKVHLKDNLVQY